MIAVLLFFVAFSTAAAQTVVENPAKPLSPNAGRIVKLEEVMRIEDTGDDYYFKNPHSIRVSPRGDVFFRDEQRQAFHFDARGRFLRSLFNIGQGPGELTHVNDIWASKDHVFLLGSPRKILVYDDRGTLIHEVGLRDLGGNSIVQADARSIRIHKAGGADASAGVGFKDIPQEIIELGPDGAVLNTFGPFYLPGHVQVLEGGITRLMHWNHFRAVGLDENTLILSTTPEYLVEVLDRDKNAVIRRFKRLYTRVKMSSERGGVGGFGPGPTTQKFSPDIFGLHVVDGKIWVQTSTVVDRKGVLFDVFDPEGRYIDSFFIQKDIKDPSGPMSIVSLTIAGGFAYFRDETEDGFIVIKKCRLVGL